MALRPEEQAKLNQLLRDGLLTQQQFNRVLGGSLEYAEALNIALENSRDTTADLYSISQDVNDELRKALGVSIKRSKQDSDILKTNNDLTNVLGKQIKDYDSIEGISRDIKKNNDLINRAEAQAKDLIRGKTKDVNKILKNTDSLAGLQNDLLKANAADAANIKQKIQDIEKENKTLIDGLTPRQQGGLLLKTNINLVKTQNNLLDEEMKKRDLINSKLGVTGGLLKGAQKIASKLGLEGLGRQFDLLNNDLEKFAEEGGGTIRGVMGKAFSGVGKIFGKALKDPLVQLKLAGGVISKVFNILKDAAFQASKTQTRIANTTGVQEGQVARIRQDLEKQADASNNVLINTDRLSISMQKMTEQTGLIANFGGQTLESFTLLTEKLGLAEKGATQLTLQARMQGKETEKVLGETVNVVNQINKQNRTALSAKDILKDVSNVSADLAVTLGQSPQKIAEAASEAKLLGISLQEVAGVADGLLQIENSLQKEMEAEIILGKELNLEKARSLALDNDMAGLAKELRSQEEIMLAFRSGNRIQQEAAAAALGLSREQLAQMIQMEDYRTMSQEQYAAAYGEQSLQQMQQLDAQEKMNASIEKFKMAMADVAVGLIPIITGFANMVASLAKSKTLVTVLIGLLVAAKVAALALAIANTVAAVAKIYGSFAQIPFGVGMAIAIPTAAAFLATVGTIGALVSKSTKAKDFRQKAGQTGVMSQTLGGLESVIPSKADDVVMGPGVVDKLEAAESINNTPGRIIGDAVLETKSKVQEKIVVNNDNSELVNQNKKMLDMFRAMNTTLERINNKDSNVYLGSEQVQKNLERSTAGMR